MSLINQMLNDLEQRRSKKKLTENAIKQNVFVVKSSFLLPRDSLYFVVMLVLLVLLVCLLIIKWHSHRTKIPHLLPPKSFATQTNSSRVMLSNHSWVYGLKIPEEDAARYPLRLVETSNSISSKIQLTGLDKILFDVQAEATIVDFKLSKDTWYVIKESPEHNEVTLELDNTHLQSLPTFEDYVDSGIKDITIVNGDNNVTIYFLLQPDAEIKSLGFDDKHPEELKLAFSHKTTDKSNSANEAMDFSNSTINVKSTATEASDKVTIDEKFQTALQMIEASRMNDAVVCLEEILNKKPVYHAAREILVTLLLQEGRTSEAEGRLLVGLHLEPNYAPFAKLYGNLLMERGDMKSALTVLQKAHPAISDDPDYYALLAAAYERLNEPKAAAKLYEQLVSFRPNNAIWWLGLGVAMDSAGEHVTALQAFEKANMIGGLSNDLQGFVDTQLHTT